MIQVFKCKYISNISDEILFFCHAKVILQFNHWRLNVWGTHFKDKQNYLQKIIYFSHAICETFANLSNLRISNLGSQSD